VTPAPRVRPWAFVDETRRLERVVYFSSSVTFCQTPLLTRCPCAPPAVVPAFHSAYLEAMVGVFGRCAQRTVDKLDALLAGAGGEGARLDMEAEYSNLALDIIGISVFNYDFGSVTKESPIIQVSLRRGATRPIPAAARSPPQLSDDCHMHRKKLDAGHPPTRLSLIPISFQPFSSMESLCARFPE
jgi:hypothetical protein